MTINGAIELENQTKQSSAVWHWPDFALTSKATWLVTMWLEWRRSFSCSGENLLGDVGGKELTLARWKVSKGN